MTFNNTPNPVKWPEDRKILRRARQKRYYEKHRDNLLPKMRKKWNRAYWRKREKKLESALRYRKNNADKVKAGKRLWQSKNSDRLKLYLKDYHRKNRDSLLLKKKIYYEKTKPERLKSCRKYAIENKEKMRPFLIASCHKRRALQIKATINLGSIKKWMASVLSRKTHVCYYCGKKVHEIHFDHIIPLSKGGPHSVENLCVSCAPCNLNKNAKSVQAWVRIGQQTLSL